jgi:hypothetical protein
MAPSTDWRERVEDGEDERFQAYAERLSAAQSRRSQRHGNGRALHRKQVMALRARLDVHGDLPAHARHGLFAAPCNYEALVRLSNGGLDVQSDREPDIRGFSVRVLGVEGAGALGPSTPSQDFALINRSVFGFARPEDFLELVLALFDGPFKALRVMIGRRGFFGALKLLGELQKATARPFAGFALEPFYSAAPIACGPYAARVRLCPERSVGCGPSADFAADMRNHLTRGPVSYRLDLQFFEDEASTPIEDASVDWSEQRAPYVNVARLTLEPRDLEGEAAARLAAEVERAIFDPWQALAAHRPLGAVMRARKHAYFASQKARGAQ